MTDVGGEVTEVGTEAGQLLDDIAIDVETAEAILAVNPGGNIPFAAEVEDVQRKLAADIEQLGLLIDLLDAAGRRRSRDPAAPQSTCGRRWFERTRISASSRIASSTHTR